MSDDHKLDPKLESQIIMALLWALRPNNDTGNRVTLKTVEIDTDFLTPFPDAPKILKARLERKQYKGRPETARDVDELSLTFAANDEAQFLRWGHIKEPSSQREDGILVDILRDAARRAGLVDKSYDNTNWYQIHGLSLGDSFKRILEFDTKERTKIYDELLLRYESLTADPSAKLASHRIFRPSDKGMDLDF